MEPEDRNKICASAQRRPRASITSVTVVIAITAIILLLANLKVGSWALSLGAVQAV